MSVCVGPRLHEQGSVAMVKYQTMRREANFITMAAKPAHLRNHGGFRAPRLQPLKTTVVIVGIFAENLLTGKKMTGISEYRKT